MMGPREIFRALGRFVAGGYPPVVQQSPVLNADGVAILLQVVLSVTRLDLRGQVAETPLSVVSLLSGSDALLDKLGPMDAIWVGGDHNGS